LKPSLIITIFVFAASLAGQAAELSLESCAAIDDPGERFACYDKLAGRSPADTAKAADTAPGGAEPAEPGADVIAPAAPAATQTAPAAKPIPDAEAVFGFEDRPKEDKPDKLQLKWTRKMKDARGKWIIFLENGQVWRQTDTRSISFRNSEQWVVISRGFAGGFLLAEPGSHKRIRVKRVK
jgi:hypothetical protein